MLLSSELKLAVLLVGLQKETAWYDIWVYLLVDI
jgi:hypothetical protein